MSIVLVSAAGTPPVLDQYSLSLTASAPHPASTPPMSSSALSTLHTSCYWLPLHKLYQNTATDMEIWMLGKYLLLYIWYLIKISTSGHSAVWHNTVRKSTINEPPALLWALQATPTSVCITLCFNIFRYLQYYSYCCILNNWNRRGSGLR